MLTCRRYGSLDFLAEIDRAPGRGLVGIDSWRSSPIRHRPAAVPSLGVNSFELLFGYAPDPLFVQPAKPKKTFDQTIPPVVVAPSHPKFYAQTSSLGGLQEFRDKIKRLGKGGESRCLRRGYSHQQIPRAGFACPAVAGNLRSASKPGRPAGSYSRRPVSSLWKVPTRLPGLPC